MPDPTTRLDPRFSDRDASATSWDAACTAVETAPVSWIATVRADGHPHVTPLVTVWLGGALRFCTGPDEQKAVNLRANPRVAVTTGCNQWEEGLDVVLEGEAVQVTDAAMLLRLAQAWAQKWDGRWQFEVRDGAFFHEGGALAPVFAVAPSKVLAFAKGERFSHTRHRF